MDGKLRAIKRVKSAGWRLWKRVSYPGFEPGEFDLRVKLQPVAERSIH